MNEWDVSLPQVPWGHLSHLSYSPSQNLNSHIWKKSQIVTEWGWGGGGGSGVGGGGGRLG